MANSGMERPMPVEGDFIYDKYGTMKFRRLDNNGRYVNFPPDGKDETSEYFKPG